MTLDNNRYVCLLIGEYDSIIKNEIYKITSKDVSIASKDEKEIFINHIYDLSSEKIKNNQQLIDTLIASVDFESMVKSENENIK